MMSEDPNDSSFPKDLALSRAPSPISTTSSAESDAEEERHNQYILIMITSLVAAVTQYSTGIYNREDYHTSALSGYAWVLELLSGHPDRIRCELGVRHHVFDLLLANLRQSGVQDSREVKLEEQLAIFLYMSVTGLSTRHVSERFQRANSTISKYFKSMLVAFSSYPFYDSQVKLPTTLDPVPAEIRADPRLYPFFKDALGALDGTHINCSPSEEEREPSRNRKGLLTQNCLMACGFDLRFLYVLSGWEGSAPDSVVYHHARLTSLPIPHGKYYLADAGFPSCDHLLVPYRGVQHHLAEWGPADQRPVNKEQLFNLRHASARNVIERIFGILKRRFRILLIAPEYDMRIQARIPAALCALHNFIRQHDPMDIDGYTDAVKSQGEQVTRAIGDLATHAINAAEQARAHQRRESLAQEMWDSYVAHVAEVEDGMDVDAESSF